MLRIAVLLVGLTAQKAYSDGDALRRLEVAVDATLETEVGYRIGFMCDDPTIVRGEMKSKTETSNVFVITGLKVGTTQCRVGTDPLRPSTLFEVRVVPAKVRSR